MSRQRSWPDTPACLAHACLPLPSRSIALTGVAHTGAPIARRPGAAFTGRRSGEQLTRGASNTGIRRSGGCNLAARDKGWHAAVGSASTKRARLWPGSLRCGVRSVQNAAGASERRRAWKCRSGRAAKGPRRVSPKTVGVRPIGLRATLANSDAVPKTGPRAQASSGSFTKGGPNSVESARSRRNQPPHAPPQKSFKIT